MAQFPQASFLTSAWQPRQFPADHGVEVAFAGRSNAGKSSALNSLLGRKDLARTSKTPGRTQLINFFALGEHARLVDLPGYGYAKVPEAMQQHWGELLTGYVRSRISLAGLVIVADARRGFTEHDQQLLDLVVQRPIALHVLLTKADKLNRSEATLTLQRVRGQVASQASAQLFSAHTGQGLEEIRRAVLGMLNEHPKKESAKKEPR